MYYVNIDLLLQHGISVAESRTFLLAHRPLATSAGDERGETSAVRILGVRKWRTRTRTTIFLISRGKLMGKASAFRSGLKNVPFLRFIFLRMHFILFWYLIRTTETMRNGPWKSASLV